MQLVMRKIFFCSFFIPCLADTVHLADAGSPSRISVECRDKDHEVLQQRPRVHLPSLETEGTADGAALSKPSRNSRCSGLLFQIRCCIFLLKHAAVLTGADCDGRLQ